MKAVTGRRLFAILAFIFAVLIAAGCDSADSEDVFVEGNYEAVTFTAETSEGETVDLLATDPSIAFQLSGLSSRVIGLLNFPEPVPVIEPGSRFESVYARIELTGTYGDKDGRVVFRDMEFAEPGGHDRFRAFMIVGEWFYKDGVLRGQGEKFFLELRKVD